VLDNIGGDLKNVTADIEAKIGNATKEMDDIEQKLNRVKEGVKDKLHIGKRDLDMRHAAWPDTVIVSRTRIASKEDASRARGTSTSPLIPEMTVMAITTPRALVQPSAGERSYRLPKYPIDKAKWRPFKDTSNIELGTMAGGYVQQAGGYAQQAASASSFSWFKKIAGLLANLKIYLIVGGLAVVCIALLVTGIWGYYQYGKLTGKINGLKDMMGAVQSKIDAVLGKVSSEQDSRGPATAKAEGKLHGGTSAAVVKRRATGSDCLARSLAMTPAATPSIVSTSHLSTEATPAMTSSIIVTSSAFLASATTPATSSTLSIPSSDLTASVTSTVPTSMVQETASPNATLTDELKRINGTNLTYSGTSQGLSSGAVPRMNIPRFFLLVVRMWSYKIWGGEMGAQGRSLS
jgi:hypothetical protein